MRVRSVGAQLAASVAVVAVVGLTALGLHQREETTVGPAAAPVADSEAIQSYADRVFESFNGTSYQRGASAVVQAWALNGPMALCMSSEGFADWDWSTARNPAPGTSALGTSLFFARPLAGETSHVLMETVDRALAEEALRKTELPAAEMAAIDRCIATTPATSDDAAAETSTPAAVASLRTDWWSLLAELDRKYGDLEAYDGCFAAGSTELPVAATAGDSWKGALAGFAPPAGQIPRTTSAPLASRPAWVRFTDLESTLEALDWRCRSATYNARIPEVRAAIERFAADHASAIDAARITWATVVESAVKLGYPGERGQIG